MVSVIQELKSGLARESGVEALQALIPRQHTRIAGKLALCVEGGFSSSRHGPPHVDSSHD